MKRLVTIYKVHRNVSKHLWFSQIYIESRRSFYSEQKAIGTLELSNIYPNQDWKDALQSGKIMLDKNRPDHFSPIIPIEAVIRKMKAADEVDQHLINCFTYLSKHDNSLLQWPSIVSMMFSKAIMDYYPVHMKDTDTIQKKHYLLYNILNTFNSRVIFGKELNRVSQFRKSFQFSNSLSIINKYFNSNIIYKAGKLMDSQVASLIASTLESYAKLDYLEQHTHPVLPKLNTTVDNWEQNVFNSEGILTANGCKAAMCLMKQEPKFTELAYQFGRFVTLATKANTDIQQFINYSDSMTSTFSLNSLPVVLHLQKMPETLAFLYVCEMPLKNADLVQVYSAMDASKSLDEAKKKLREYVCTSLTIISEFKESEAAMKLMSLTQTLNKFEE